MIQNREEILDFIKKNKDDVLFVGIGNRLRRDDGIGCVVASRGRNFLKEKFIDIGVSFENYLFKILERREKIIVFIDGMRIKSDFVFLEIDELIEQGISTHSLSLKRMKEIFDGFGKRVYVLGINVRDIGVGEEISEEVFERGKRILNDILKCMN